MHTFGGKAQQQARGKRLGGWWKDLLLSFSTGFVHDPILHGRVGIGTSLPEKTASHLASSTSTL